MSELLRVYDPIECDDRGWPLDWERCRRCEGKGRLHGLRGIGGENVYHGEDVACPVCDGHGSLKAAALFHKATTSDHPDPRVAWQATTVLRMMATNPGSGVGVCCVDCGHPMSDGTWEPERQPSALDGSVAYVEEHALLRLRAGTYPEAEVGAYGPVHWSACDGCSHGGPGRWHRTDAPEAGRWECSDLSRLGPYGAAEASWRAVDVRVGMRAKRAGMEVIGAPAVVVRPFDLTPENVALLCQRCWAAR